MVNALGQSTLEDLSLQPPLQEVLDLQRQHVIETHALLVKHTNANKTTDQGISLEKSLGVLLVQLEELSGGTTNLGQDERDAPNLALVAETVLSSELKLGVKTSRLEWAAGDLQRRGEA